ncbi:uncharacterized protein LOC109805941 [Cajanus cajan]|uniref:uncharacterized protein LOC109805941 n=1 Tax=Cajanus cajan TaxID=3821 RepID=UPI00098D7FAD|nr:uncharacterized protein LOC109805941 [Cajanus cajan]
MAIRGNLVFAIFVLIASIVAVRNIPRISAQCGGAFSKIADSCGEYIKKGDSSKTQPSQDCCDVIKQIDLPCACKYVNSTIEAMISMDKVVQVVRSCGVTIASGTHCGSYVVHPSQK